MANIASGYLFIRFNNKNNIDEKVINEIINNIENNNNFTYGGTSEGVYDKDLKSLDLTFNGRWSCDSCWDWLEKEMSEARTTEEKELSEPAQMLLINSEFGGGSYEYGSQYRDRVKKAIGERNLTKLSHMTLDSTWPEALDVIDAFSIKEKESVTYGNDVEIQILDKSEEGLFLFKVSGGVGGCILLINKENEEIEFFSDMDELDVESIQEILDGLENEEIEQEEEPEDWYGTNELIDDLLGDRDDMYELDED